MISAIVLAAGQSTRMGEQKMLLPWGQTTVISKVVATLWEAGIVDIHVVTGGTQSEVKKLLPGYKVSFVFNRDYQNGEMLTSIQVGLQDLGHEPDATLIVLGDQPQIEGQVVKTITGRFRSTRNPIIVPSYKMRRGHPWLLAKPYWPEVLELTPPSTLRDFLNAHQDKIDYINVASPSILQDLDTQSDYDRYKP